MLKSLPVTTMLPTTDLARARKFYEGTLGLTPSDKSMADEAVMYECGSGTAISVYRTNAKPGENTAACFWVADVDKEMADLLAKGVKFEDYDFPGLKTENGVATMDGIRSSWFKDPDGNIIALTEMKK